MAKLDWASVLDALERFKVQPPPLNFKAEQWLRQQPELKGFAVSKPVQVWADWLCAVWAGQLRQIGHVPDFPATLSGQQWREQADRAEDHRRAFPQADEWLTVYVTYLHACADVIDELRRLSGHKVSA